MPYIYKERHTISFVFLLLSSIFPGLTFFRFQWRAYIVFALLWTIRIGGKISQSIFKNSFSDSWSKVVFSSLPTSPSFLKKAVRTHRNVWRLKSLLECVCLNSFPWRPGSCSPHSLCCRARDIVVPHSFTRSSLRETTWIQLMG